MSLYQGIFKRDMHIAFNQKAELVQPLMFLLMVVTLFPLGVSPSPDTLQRIGPGVIWIAAILSSLMAMERLFRDDFQDGSLEQYMLSGLALPAVSAVKVSGRPAKSGSAAPASVTRTVVGPVSSGKARLTVPPSMRVTTPML